MEDEAVKNPTTVLPLSETTLMNFGPITTNMSPPMKRNGRFPNTPPITIHTTHTCTDLGSSNAGFNSEDFSNKNRTDSVTQVSTDSVGETSLQTYPNLKKFRYDHPRQLVLGHLNVNSLRNKFIEIREMLKVSEIDILGLSETKLDDSFGQSTFHCPNYTAYRQDRDIHGGGIACYVSSALPHRRRDDLCVNELNFQSLVVEVIHQKTKFLVVVLYNPPSTPSNKLPEIFERLCNNVNTDSQTMFLTGDFNVNISNKQHALADVFQIHGLKNLIRGPTCFKSEENPSLVDLILTNQPQKVLSHFNHFIGISDFHSLVCIAMRLSRPRLEKRTITYRSYKHFNQSAYVHDLSSTPFHIANLFDDVDDQLWAYETLLHEVVNDHAPLKTKTVRGRHCPYMHNELRKAINVKGMLHRKYLRNRSRTSWEDYRRQRNKVTKMKRLSIQVYFNKHCDRPQNPNFWQVIRPFMGSSLHGGDNIQLQEGGSVISDGVLVCETFNDYFINAAANLSEPHGLALSQVEHITTHYKDHPSVNFIKTHASRNCPEVFTFRPVSQDAIYRKLIGLKTNKSTGYDQIPAKLIKAGAAVIQTPLTVIMNNSIASHKFPDLLKHGEIVPVFKSKNALSKTCYRPVTILTSVSKVFEAVMCDQITTHMEDMMSTHLAAYRKRYSCSNVLFRCVENWKNALDNNESVACILMDLSKAFDCIPHALLIAKLQAYNFSRNSCELVKSYLTNRRQRVKLGSTRSSWRTLERGVPQGSLTGPLLFNVFLNDLVMQLADKCDIFNYADDNSLSFHHHDPTMIKNVLESACSAALDWFDLNHMRANPDKFQAIVLSRQPNTMLPLLKFRVKDATISPDPCVKLLGVLLDNKLSFSPHITTLCKRTARQIGALRRVAPQLTSDVRMKLHDTFIMSNLIYSSSAWFECSKTSRWKLEKVHERAMRVATNDYMTPYKDLLKKTNRCSLYVQHLRTFIELVYKILHDEAPPIDSNFFQVQKVTHNLRDRCMLAKPKFSTINYGFHSLRYQGPHLWNQLPYNIKHPDDFVLFKSKLKSWSPSCSCGSCILCILCNT